jgi:DNA-binding NarL/FixJ family response regulator/tetratricopeptide (TPR) repeat protein
MTGSDTASANGRTRWPLVAREQLVARALEGLDRGPVVISGFAGVGKTGLATLVRRQLEAQGNPVVWTGAIPAGRDVPFSTFAGVTAAPGAADEDGSDSPARIRAAISGALGPSGAGTLVVDDAQWLDVGAQQLVRQLAASGTRILLTVRTGEPGSDDWLALVDDGFASAIDLDRADLALCTAIVTEALGETIAPQLATALHERSGGNLLFLRELVIAGRDSGAIDLRRRRWELVGDLPVDGDVASAIARRLRSLSDAEMSALAAVALLEPVSDDLFAQLPDGDHVVELERRGLVDTAVDGTLRVSHPLLSAAARVARTGSARRREVDRVTEAVLGKLDDHSGDLALRLVTVRVDHALLTPVAWAAAAAGRAFSLLDHDLAVRLGRAAVDVDPSDAEAQLALGAALSAQFRTAEAEPHLRAALDGARSDSQRARAAGRLGLHLGIRIGDPDEALAVMRDVRDRISDPEWRSFLDADIGKIELMSGRSQAAPADPSNGATPPAPMEPVARLNQAIMTALVHATAGSVRAAGDEVALGLELAPDHVGVLPNARDLLQLAAFIARIVAGDVDGAEHLAQDELARCTVERDEPEGLWWSMLATAALSTGKPSLAAERARRAIPLVAARDFVGGLHASTTALLGVALAQIGRVDDARGEIASIEPAWLADPRTRASVLQAEAWMLCADPATPSGRAGETFAAGAAVAADTGMLAPALPIAYDAVRIGEPEPVLPVLSTISAAAPESIAAMFLRHAEALVSTDPAALAAVADDLARAGLPVFAGEAKHQASRFLAATNPARARWLAAEARALVRGAGVTSSTIVPLDDASDGSPGGAPETLTERQLQVARLAAARWRSREIAEHLGVSTRTVDNLLGRVYKALGVASRDELAAVLGRTASER